ncbi:lytic murein transglycosylase [Rhodoligotrophos defluvii]|uniref:lytic murein transglycosylase n=1 Tax=Rhodoligotrophos defluvii TaxID=2561934 RepID=UPI0010C9C50C|nr:lytic murein transglycosylase [Rhodoligotrophos defluvii]
MLHSRHTRVLQALALLASFAASLFAIDAGAAAAPAAQRARIEGAFRQWIEQTVWPDAGKAGVSRRTFEKAFAGITLDWSLPDLAPPGVAPERPSPQRQPEFSSPGRYFSEKQIASLVGDGRRLLTTWSKTLDRIERQYGVPREIIVAIWGRESGYGRVKIPHDAIRALATEAFMGRRKSAFYPELIAALKILEEEHIGHAEMKSSWAGALGQPQFQPTKFLRFAVDFDGDGHRNIWTSVPDTLASIAHYLQQHGWVRGSGWGVEARVPANVSCTLEGPEQGRPLAEWAAMGVRRVDGRPLPAFADTAFLLMPAGRLGPAFIVSRNFYVLKAYNESDLYALFIGHLADRYGGAGPIAGRWADVSGFTRQHVQGLQQRLVQAGYDVGGVDGLIGFKSRIAVGKWQTRQGLEATCFPDRDLVLRR